MKKFGCALMVLLFVTLVFTGCPGVVNNTTQTDADGATLRFVITGLNNARTVFPDIKQSDLSDVKLTYRKTTDTVESVKEWPNFNAIAAIPLSIGTYNFTLEAKCKGFNYSGSVENVTISNGENTIEFNLNLSSIAAEDMEGQGTIRHTYTFPTSEEIKFVKAGLFTYDDDDELVEVIAPEALTITDNEDGTSTVAYSRLVDSAEYVLKYFFYADDEATIVIDTYSVTVYVLKGVTSKADESTAFLCSVYTITYELNGGSWKDGYTAPTQFTYSSEVTLDVENVVRPGYHLVKWTETNDAGAAAITELSVRAGDVRVYAIWEANTDTRYTVKHWQQNIEDDEYTLVSGDTVIMTGTTATATAASANTYTGFDALTFSQGTIAGDGSTVVNIYYNRKIYYITLVLGSSTTTTELDEQGRISGRYGAPVVIERPVLAGAVFQDWINENNESESLPATFSENRTFIATFIGNAAGISVSVNGIEDITVTAAYISEANKIVITADEGFSGYNWTVNGVRQSSTTKRVDITPNGSESYNVELTAKKNGIRYSSNIIVNVESMLQSGFIIMRDGSYISPEAYSSYSGTATPVGIVCHVNDDGRTGLMLGLCNSSAGTNSGYKRWAPSVTTGYNTNFTAIQGTKIGGDRDGSDNWAEICKVDPEGTENPATNYPAFNYALTYAETANLTGTEYAEGWYMPTCYELYNYIYKNKTVLTTALSAAGGTSLSTYYWSSSQVSNGSGSAYYVTMSNGNVGNTYRYNDYYVCCLRAF